MKKHIMIIVITVLFISIGLSGCTQRKNTKVLTDEDYIIGTWINHTLIGQDVKTVIYVFSSDKTYEISGKFQDLDQKTNGTWEFSNNKLIFYSKDQEQICDYVYSNNYNTLTITDPQNRIMEITKQ